MNIQTKNKIIKALKEIANHIIDSANPQLKLSYDSDVFFEKYDEYNLLIKEDIVGKDTLRIDRHKVATCLTLAVLSTQPIKNMDETLQNENYLYYLCNECLAIFISLYMLKHFTQEDDSMSISVRDKIKKRGFVFPTTANNNYIIWLASSLSRIGEYRDRATLSLLSNIYFMIERYTIEKYFNDDSTDENNNVESNEKEE